MSLTQRRQQRSSSDADVVASDGVVRRCPHCSVVIVGDDLDLVFHADDFAELVDFAAVTCAVCRGTFLWPAPPRLLLHDGGGEEEKASEEKQEKKKQKKKKKQPRRPGKNILRFLGLLGLAGGTALSLGLCGLATVVVMPFAFVVGGAVLLAVCGVYACGVAWFKT